MQVIGSGLRVASYDQAETVLDKAIEAKNKEMEVYSEKIHQSDDARASLFGD